MTRDLTHAFCQLFRDTRRGDLIHLTVVFRVVVEELITGHHLCNRQQHRLLLCLIDTLRDLSSLKEALHHHLRTLHHGLADGGGKLILVLHLRYAKRRTVGSRLHEARHTDTFLYLVIAHQLLIAFADEQTLCHAHAIAAQVLVQHELIKRQCLNQNTTRAVGKVNQLEVALQDTVLARGAMNGDIGIVEHHQLTILLEREIILVDRCRGTVIQVRLPAVTFDDHDIYVVFFLVEKGVQTLC